MYFPPEAGHIFAESRLLLLLAVPHPPNSSYQFLRCTPEDNKISTATLTKINRDFAVCILIQAKEGSKAALFGRKSNYSPYDLASWTSGDNLLMVKN